MLADVCPLTAVRVEALCAKGVAREGDQMVVGLVAAGVARVDLDERRDGTGENDAGDECDDDHDDLLLTTVCVTHTK